MQSYAIILDAAGALVDFEKLEPASKKAARIAINKAADSGRTSSAKYVREQLNLPASYVSPSQKRLYVDKRATNANPEATIVARKRGTSLARFVSNARPGRRDVSVQVKPGLAVFMKNVHIIKLKSGGSEVDTAHNLGLGVFTKNGKRPNKAYKPVQMKNGMWLLYGPSVAQALLSAKGTGIWTEMDDELQEKMIREYLRQMEL